MKVGIFVYNISNIKFNVNSIVNSTDYYFVLMANQKTIANLTLDNRNAFSEIIAFDDVTLLALDASLQKFLDSYARNDIFLMTNDESCTVICAQLRDRYHLLGPSESTMLPFVDKGLMKKKLQNTAIRCPRYVLHDDDQLQENTEHYLSRIENYLNYPMIVKPTTSYGSLNTEKIQDRRDLIRCLSDANAIDQFFEIDEFIEGDLYHCDGIVLDKKMIVFFACRYNTPCANFTKGVPLGSLILLNQNPLRARLLAFTESCLTALDVPDGAFHLEAFVNHRDEIIFLEVGARAPGAMVIPTYELMTKINLEEMHFRVQLHQSIQTVMPGITKYAAWICYPKHRGFVRGFNPHKSLSVCEIRYLVKENDLLEQASGLLDVSATLLITNQSYAALTHEWENLFSFEPIHYEQESE